MSSLASGLAYASACALVLAAPFERLEPSLVWPGQALTNLEVVIVIALASWLTSAWLAGAWPRWRTPLTSPAIAFIILMLVAALAAPAHQANAMRLVGRLVIGFSVFVLVANAVAREGQIVGIISLAVASGAVVGALAILEYLSIPAVLGWLQQFRPGLPVVGGQPRATSTLQYPTITSMYLEIVFALGLGLLLWAIDRRRSIAATLIFSSLVLIAEAVNLTLTRAGMVTVVASLVVVGGLRWVRRGTDQGLAAVTALAAIFAGLVASSLTLESARLRFTTEGQRDWYKASFVAPAELNLSTGGVQAVELTAVNTGRVTWQSDGDPPFRLSYHWLEEGGQRVIQFDGLRTEFPQPVPPGTAVRMRAHVQAPPRPGRYRLAWDVVLEDRLWFSTEGPASAAGGLTVVSVTGKSVKEAWLKPKPLPAAAFRIDRRALWRIALRMFASHPLLGVGPDNFRLLYGQFAGPRSDPRVHSNNMYLEVLIGGGVVASAAFLWLLWRVAKRVRDTWRSLEGPREAIHLGVAAAVGAILLHGLVDSFLTFTPTYLTIWMSLGLVEACGSSLVGTPNANRV